MHTEAPYRDLTRITAVLGLFNLMITAIAGLLLRYQFIYPANWINYYNWLHAHSHVAFLGWVYFGLIALIIREYFDHTPRGFGWIIVLTQVSVIGMLLTFAQTGYSPSAIAFSAMHMVLSIILSVIIFRKLKENKSISTFLIRISLVMMILSGLGPLVLGPVVVLGYRNSVWYEMAIYFYLHFQYNGWFLLAILGLFSGFLETNSIHIDIVKARRSVLMLGAGIFLTYLLSSLGFKPPIWIYGLGALGALFQLWGLGFWFKTAWLSRKVIMKKLPSIALKLLYIAFIALAMKAVLQLFSPIPSLAAWVYQARDIIISYMHMVLMGFVSCFLLAWILYRFWLRKGFLLITGVIFFLTGLIFTNGFLIARKFLPRVDPQIYLYGLLIAALLLLVSSIIFFLNSLYGKKA